MQGLVATPRNEIVILKQLQSLEDLAYEKAKLLTEHTNAGYRISHTSLIALLFVGLTVAVGTLYDAYKGSDSEKNPSLKITSIITVVLNLLAAYFEKRDSLKKAITEKDLDIVMQNIAAVGPPVPSSLLKPGFGSIGKTLEAKEDSLGHAASSGPVIGDPVVITTLSHQS